MGEGEGGLEGLEELEGEEDGPIDLEGEGELEMDDEGVGEKEWEGIFALEPGRDTAVIGLQDESTKLNKNTAK